MTVKNVDYSLTSRLKITQGSLTFHNLLHLFTSPLA